jgi:hypothetical protein
MMYPTAKVLTQQGAKIVLSVDWMGAERVIRLDDNASATAPSMQGYSHGRWQGKTLYVDTQHFSANPIGNMFSVAARILRRHASVQDSSR